MKVALSSFAFPEFTVSLGAAMEKHCETTVFLPECYRGVLAAHPRIETFSYDPGKTLPGKWRAAGELLWKLNRLAPDIVHFQGCAQCFLPFVPLLQGFRVVTTVHDPVAHEGEERAFSAITQSMLVTISSRVILLTEAMRQLAAGVYPAAAHKLMAIPHGLYDIYVSGPELRPPDLPPHQKFVLFFGRVGRYKGIEDLFAAIRKLRDQSDARFVIAGRHLYPVRVPADISDRVTMLKGYIQDDVLRYLFRHCQLVVLPYRNATQSGVLMIAYAFGKPVIATQTGGMPEMICHGETGIVVPPRDAEALSRGIVDLLGAPERLAAMGKKAVEFGARNYSWDKIALATFGVYQAICARQE